MPISLDDFKKVEFTVGKILAAEKVPETDKLLKLSVDFGSPLEKGVSPFLEGRVVTTPVFADSGTTFAVQPPKAAPFIKGDNNPLAPFIKGDITTPVPSLEKEGRQESEADIPPQRDIRQIVSGIATYFPEPQTLVGKKCMFVTNIEPRMIKGLQSNGMILALSTEDGKFSLLEPNNSIPEGTRAK